MELMDIISVLGFTIIPVLEGAGSIPPKVVGTTSVLIIGAPTLGTMSIIPLPCLTPNKVS